MNLIPWKRKKEDQPEDSAALPVLRRDIDSLFDRFFQDPWGLLPWRTSSAEFGGCPQTDLAESENDVTVKMELPGVEPKDVHIEITGGVLTVRGEKKHEKAEREKNYHYVERAFGSFQRGVRLPGSVDPDKVDAAYKNGVLTITIAKHPEAKPKRIPVRSGQA